MKTSPARPRGRGVNRPQVAEVLHELYARPANRASIPGLELGKFGMTSSCQLSMAMKISFINEMATLRGCGCGYHQVRKESVTISESASHSFPGVGYGGSAFRKMSGR